MSISRKERRRRILLRRKFLNDKRILDNFLYDKTSMNGYFKDCILKYPELPAITDTYKEIDITYKQLEEQISALSAMMQIRGLEKGDFISIFSENNGRWAICEQAAMRCGAICTLRGSKAPSAELTYIINHSEAKALIVENTKLLKDLSQFLKNCHLKFIIVMFCDEKENFDDYICPVYTFEDAIQIGEQSEFAEPVQNIDEPCLMLYTSGTTGEPKGVLITHKNLLCQVLPIMNGIKCKAGDNTLQILPVWHAYEHMIQLYFFTVGCHLHFTTLSGLKNDLIKYDITTLMSVPRIWEAMRLGIFQKLKQKSIIIYKLFDFGVKLSINYKIHKMYSERRITNKKGSYHFWMNLYHKLVRSFLKPFHILLTNTLYKKIKQSAGINFRVSISGGGALSMKDQLFYDAIGVNLREGYGLTETSPVITLRNIDEPNFLGCCGKPLMGVEIKILDVDTKEELGILKKGIVYAKGYQITNGYYKNEEATREVFCDDGWFNTGDIGWLTADNNLVLVGREKETIVLSSGENVEPVPIEEACLESPYIDQIMLVGQDKFSIGALIVPSEEALKKCGLLAQDIKSGTNLTISNPTLRELIKKEIASHINNKKNLKPFEKIKNFEVLNESFSASNGLMSQTAKMKRNNISEKYEKPISEMYDDK